MNGHLESPLVPRTHTQKRCLALTPSHGRDGRITLSTQLPPSTSIAERGERP